jgi:hypothetical protein
MGNRNDYARALICSITLACFSILTGPAIGDTEGHALAKMIYERPDGSDAASQTIMTLTENTHKPRYRTLFSYRLDSDDGATQTLIRFTQPADIDGTGLLTLDHPGKESSQWIYLPALDRVRRIASSRKGGRFVGSDFYYEDLQKREVGKDHHKIIGTGKIGSIETTLLESIPVQPGNSVYSKRISWVHINSLTPLKVEYYTDGRATPIKRLEVSRIKKIQGYWTVIDCTMHDLDSGHQTRLTTKAIKYDQDLPKSLFTNQALSDPEITKAYRP